MRPPAASVPPHAGFPVASTAGVQGRACPSHCPPHTLDPPHVFSSSAPGAPTALPRLPAALDYLHRRRIIHRDIKLENLLLQWPNALDTLTIADMGFAVSLAGGPAGRRTMAGTPAYLAPELILAMQDGDTGSMPECLTPALDMWAAGISIFLLLGGYPPFEGTTTRDLFNSILDTPLSFDAPSWRDVSPEGRHFVSRLLDKDMSTRATAAEALRHPWLAGLEWERGDVNVPKDRDPTDPFIKPSFFLKLQERHATSVGHG